jgi:hypothetical protein
VLKFSSSKVLLIRVQIIIFYKPLTFANHEIKTHVETSAP